MPLRLRRTRVSVQQLATGQDPDEGTPTKAWTHLRWQKFDLFPVDGTMLLRLERAGYKADWIAVGRARPAVLDGQRIVTMVGGSQELVFKVTKVNRHGRDQEVLLKEVPETQLPADGV